MSSFLQQYGIRLQYEYDTIKYVEFNQLLRGINGDTPLGYVVRVRSEKDTKRISEMSANEKEIRRNWQEFKSKQEKKEDKKVIYIKKEDISKIFSKMF